MATESLKITGVPREEATRNRQPRSVSPVPPLLSELDGSPWSLSCTESEDQSSEATAPPASCPAPMTPSLNMQISYNEPSPPEPKVVLRRQPRSQRRRAQRAQTLGCYPPPAIPTSPSGSPSHPKPSSTSGMTTAIGLDCFELRRRSLFADPTKRFSQPTPFTASLDTPSKVEAGVMRTRTSGVRRIQSLTRCPQDSETRQLSWESLRTKPPKPPTAHNLTSASLPPSEAIDVDVPVGRVAEMVNRVEALISKQKSQQLLQTPSPLREIRSLDQADLSTTTNRFFVDGVRNYSHPRIVKQQSAPGSLPCRLRLQPSCISPPIESSEALMLEKSSSMRSPLTSHELDTCNNEAVQRLKRRSTVYASLPTTLEESIPVGSKSNETSSGLDSLPRQASPTPPKIMDEAVIGNLRQQRQIVSHSRLHTSSTITLYELIQFCHLSSTFIPSHNPPDRLLCESWEAGKPIPGLGIYVSVVSVNLPPHARLPRAWNEYCFPKPLPINPGSAFTPISTAIPNGCTPPAPLVLIIDEVQASGALFFQPGQIILEVNGVNLLSLPATSKQDLMMRLLQLVFGAHSNGDGGLSLTIATPYPGLVRRVNHEMIEVQLLYKQ
ncbi:unnamed protein product [Mesocestoides corti]|nr:unnamed protein product [Mesocestoides corti]